MKPLLSSPLPKEPGMKKRLFLMVDELLQVCFRKWWQLGKFPEVFTVNRIWKDLLTVSQLYRRASHFIAGDKQGIASVFSSLIKKTVESSPLTRTAPEPPVSCCGGTGVGDWNPLQASSVWAREPASRPLTRRVGGGWLCADLRWSHLVKRSRRLR